MAPGEDANTHANRNRHVAQLTQTSHQHQNAYLRIAKDFFFLKKEKKKRKAHNFILVVFCTPISGRLGQILLSVAK